MFFGDGEILKDVKLICEQFVSILFVTIPLRYICVVIAFASVAKENKAVIFFLFLTV